MALGLGKTRRHNWNGQRQKGSTVRRDTAIVVSIIYLAVIIFLILAEIGNTHIRPVLTDIYLYRLVVADIIPLSVPNARLLNTIARSLGLHDFYQVGLWNYCAGYQKEGVTECSTPERWFWFNPVEVLTSELLAGATIALPSAVNTVLRLLRIGQQVMFGFFLAGLLLCGLQLIATPLVLRARLWSLPLSIGAIGIAICVNSGAVIATVLAVGAKYGLTAQDELNIRADIGVRMFVLIWLAAGCTSVAFILHAGMGCFCLIRRDPLQTESNAQQITGNSSAIHAEERGETKKRKSRFPFGRQRIRFG